MPITDTILDRGRAWLDCFLLKRSERTAARTSEAARPRVAELVRAGRERARVADSLVESHVSSALPLYREAALLMMAAFVTGGGGAPLGEPLTVNEVLDRFGASDVRGEPRVGGAKRAAFLDWMRAADPLAVERMGTVDAIAFGQTARAIVDWLGGLVEPRTVREIVFERRTRVGVAGLAGLLLVIWAGSSIFNRENIALHKPVSVSGVHPRATSPPSGLTDGVTSGTYGVHTNSCEAPFVQVDLQDVYVIDTVKIYNRGDGWFDDGLPMTLQFSEDGTTFTDVEVRKASFSQLMPWKADGGHRRARYVRVNGAKGRYVTLSELEVFGKKP